MTERMQNILDLLDKNEGKINDYFKQKKKDPDSVDPKRYKVLLGKKMSLLTSSLSEMDREDPFIKIVNMLHKEVEEKYYQE